eukprot:gene6097-1882_t
MRANAAAALCAAAAAAQQPDADINRYVFNGSAGTVRFSSSFLHSKFYDLSIEKGKIAPSMLAAETSPPKKLGPLSAAGANDNNYIKPRKIVGKE